MSKKCELWIDMDETIVGFSEYIVSQYNEDFNDNFDYKENTSYWWGSCKKASKSYFEKLLKQEGTFKFPLPIENSIETLTKLYHEGFDIHIITLPEMKSLYCVKEKIEWIEKYLPFINISTNFHMTGNKGIAAKPNRILLDDNSTHLNSWKNGGGIAIAFKNHSWSNDWYGFRVNNFNEFYNLVHLLNNSYNTPMTPIIDTDKFKQYYNNKLRGMNNGTTFFQIWCNELWEVN